MLVKILKDTQTPTHSLKKGDLVNLQSHIAALLINSKDAKVATAKDIKAMKNGD